VPTPIRQIWVAGSLLLSCTGPGPPPAPYAYLTPVEHLVRASMALRGIRPAPAEVLTVQADPGALPAIVDAYLRSPELGETVKDMHAELYLVRADTNDPFPPVGALAGYTFQELYVAASEEPLELVWHVVDADLPYSEIVTADYVLANEALAAIYGLDYDAELAASGAEWQRTHYVDGRPHAGVLSTSEPYRRHVSNGSNFHRGRANFWATTLLCEPFSTRDVVVEGGVDLSDEAAVAAAVSTNPTCIGCHQALDPMADLFWGFRRQLTGRNLRIGEAEGCRVDDVAAPVNDPEQDYSFLTDLCVPLRFYTPANEGLWADAGLAPPAYYGEPVRDLADLGREIAADPRFSQCSARQFYRWLGQIDLEEVGPAQSAALQASLEAHGMRVRPYLREIVLSDQFRARERIAGADVPDALPPLVTRPEQYARTVEALTGFRWLAVADEPGCAECWGPVDLARSDVFGYRAMAGGIDGLTVTQPTHTVTPVKLLVTSRLAYEAAGTVVASDFALPASERRLLGDIEPGVTDERAVRVQLAALSLTVLSEPVVPGAREVDGWYALFTGALAEHGGDTAAAWTVTVAGFLRDPALLYY
jgi:hypothetical protein